MNKTHTNHLNFRILLTTAVTLFSLSIVNAQGDEVATLGSVGEQKSIKKPTFILEKGNKNLVCQAFLERLQVSDLTANYGYFPQCRRPEIDTVDGFLYLKKVPLSVDEVVKLYGQVQAFISEKNSQFYSTKPAYKDTGESNRLSISERFAVNDEIKASNNWPLGLFDPLENRPYRFEGFIDIDNDGIGDDIIIWRDPQQECGKGYENRGNRPLFYPDYAFVLDRQGNIDDKRTLDIFSSPALARAVKYINKKTGEVGSLNFYRPSTSSTGIVIYQNQTYFDGFYYQADNYDHKGNNSNQPRKYGLFQYKQGKTKVVCELLWTGQY